MQFWAGDRAQAMAALRLIADLEPIHNPEFDILFSARFDCPAPAYSTTVQYVARKFNVFTYTSTSKRTGWPAGCNALWLDSMHHIADSMQSGRMPRYKWVLCMESDDAPLTKNWLEELDRSWDRHAMYVQGNVVQFPKWHCNGNAMFSCDPEFMAFLRKVKTIPNLGWDFVLADQFRWWGWADVPAIRSIWGTKSLSPESIQSFISGGCHMLHGVKDNSVLSWGRQNLLRRG